MDFLKTYQNYPYFFANANVHLSLENKKAITDFIQTCFVVFQHPLYQQMLNLNDSFHFNTHGVLAAFDFHLTKEYPQLIEINTNAGGAFLNCALLSSLNKNQQAQNLSDKIVASFQQEWQLFNLNQNNNQNNPPLKTIAIVDENPKEQFLYPEFLLAQNLFEEKGIQTWIADPSEFSILNDSLVLNHQKIDLIYNRLTDFNFNHFPLLKKAYIEKKALFTPSPYHYHLTAQKDNLLILFNSKNWEQWNLNENQQNNLKNMIPPLFKVDSEDFWQKRKQFFFKPFCGFGSKAVYRGDKLTKKVFEEILKNNYVAQQFVAPSTHEVWVDNQMQIMKADIRAYVYQNEVLHFAARLYQGQTTNFRTHGGGFALCV